MNPTFVCTDCNKPGTFAEITQHDDSGRVFVCQNCGAQFTVIAGATARCEVVSDDMSVLFPPTSAAPTPRLDKAKVLAELKSEREQIEEAIQSLELLARGRGMGPGRPPNWMADEKPKRRRKSSGSSDPGSQPPPAAPAAARIANRLDRVPSDDEQPPLEAAS